MIREVLYGVAVADAIGNPLEFLRGPTPQDFLKAATGQLVVSDDTQMMMFSLEALTLGWNFKAAVLRWYRTQTKQRALGDGLLSFPEMFDVQAPGNTCMAAGATLSRGEKVSNDSKGNGTVMRCAHIAHWCWEHGFSLDQAIALASLDAGTTHLHPLAALCSEALTFIHWKLATGHRRHSAVRQMIIQYEDRLPLAISALISVMLLESEIREKTTFDRVRMELGGWVAEEALSIAIGAFLHNDDYLEAVYDATVIPGDSDTVGAITGGLMAAAGFPAPEEFVASLNVRRVMGGLLELADCN